MNCPNNFCEGLEELPSTPTMEYIDMYDCYICPWCNSEVWLSDRGKEITTRDALETLKSEWKRQNMMRKKTSGGNKKSGRKREQKKPVAWFVNE